MFIHLSTQHQILAWIYLIFVIINFIMMLLYFCEGNEKRVNSSISGVFLFFLFLTLLLWGAA